MQAWGKPECCTLGSVQRSGNFLGKDKRTWQKNIDSGKYV